MRQPDGALQTCLLEVNDGYSLGVYPGISGKDYTDLLISRRWIFLDCESGSKMCSSFLHVCLFFFCIHQHPGDHGSLPYQVAKIGSWMKSTNDPHRIKQLVMIRSLPRASRTESRRRTTWQLGDVCNKLTPTTVKT